jgi:hypothetical protein
LAKSGDESPHSKNLIAGSPHRPPLAAGYFLHNADFAGICPYNRKYRHFQKKRKILPKS